MEDSVWNRLIKKERIIMRENESEGENESRIYETQLL